MAAAAITHIVCTRRPAVRKDYIIERLKKPANNTCRLKKLNFGRRIEDYSASFSSASFSESA